MSAGSDTNICLDWGNVPMLKPILPKEEGRVREQTFTSVLSLTELFC